VKLEKREITLNEYDSIKDGFCQEKALLGEYVSCLCLAERKETKAELLSMMKEVGEDMLFLRELMSGKAIENAGSGE